MKISSENLKIASCYAMMEANRWKNVATKIDDEKGLLREKIVILSYAAELYLKSILMYNDINITTIPQKQIGNGHNLYNLYNLLPDNIKNVIVDELKIEPIVVKDFYTGIIKNTYISFEEILELMSNNFLDLRYNYERYANRRTYFGNRGCN